MGLFNKNNNQNASWLTEDDNIAGIEADYSAALNYLTGLSDEEFKKVIEVAKVYRDADDKHLKILGKKRQATTFIYPLVDDDDDGSKFMELLDAA